MAKMYLKISFLIALIFMVEAVSAATFWDQQIKHYRVKEAYRESKTAIDSLLSTENLKRDKLKIFLRVFKTERTVELWATDSLEYKLIKEYPFTAYSGVLGPKRQEGDLQIPEGFYYIDRFNPFSNFYLSLGLNYPNRSDKIRKRGDDPGSDIFIHGYDVTIGCIPIGNPAIKELYCLAVIAKSAGQRNIPVHIFPFKYNKKNIKIYFHQYPRHNRFWRELEPFYNKFQSDYQLPKFEIDSTGKYLLVE